jgi:hypothetical protein
MFGWHRRSRSLGYRITEGSGVEGRFFRIASAQVMNSKTRRTPQASVMASTHSNWLRNIQDCKASSAQPKPITAAPRMTR